MHPTAHFSTFQTNLKGGCHIRYRFREAFGNFRTCREKTREINEGCEIVSAIPTSAADQPLVKGVE